MFKKLFEPTSSPDEDNASTIPPEEDIDPFPLVEEVIELTPPTEEENSATPQAESVESVASPEGGNASVQHSYEDIHAVRELILALHPAIVPELIGGESVASIIASIEPAQDAYRRIVSGVHVPAGGNAPITIEPDSLTTFEKIRHGLSVQTQRKG